MTGEGGIGCKDGARLLTAATLDTRAAVATDCDILRGESPGANIRREVLGNKYGIRGEGIAPQLVNAPPVNVLYEGRRRDRHAATSIAYRPKRGARQHNIAEHLISNVRTAMD